MRVSRGTPPLLLTEKDLSVVLQISTRSVRRLREGGALPAPVWIGVHPRWRVDAIRKWLEAGMPGKPRRPRHCRHDGVTNVAA